MSHLSKGPVENLPHQLRVAAIPFGKYSDADQSPKNSIFPELRMTQVSVNLECEIFVTSDLHIEKALTEAVQESVSPTVFTWQRIPSIVALVFQLLYKYAAKDTNPIATLLLVFTAITVVFDIVGVVKSYINWNRDRMNPIPNKAQVIRRAIDLIRVRSMEKGNQKSRRIPKKGAPED